MTYIIPAVAALVIRFARRYLRRRARMAMAWLTDARLYVADVVRGRGRGTGLHVLPAGETPDDDDDPFEEMHEAWRRAQSADPTKRTCCTHPGTGLCMCDCHDWLDQLPQLPVQVGSYNDPLREHIDAAWAATGVTQGQWWREHAPDVVDDLVAEYEATGNLPGPARRTTGVAAASPEDRYRAGEPTPAQRQGLWSEHLAPHVVAALTRARPDETVITPRDHQAWFEELCGGDVFDGKGSAEGYVEWLFAGLKVPA